MTSPSPSLDALLATLIGSSDAKEARFGRLLATGVAQTMLSWRRDEVTRNPAESRSDTQLDLLKLTTLLIGFWMLADGIPGRVQRELAPALTSAFSFYLTAIAERAP